MKSLQERLGDVYAALAECPEIMGVYGINKGQYEFQLSEKDFNTLNGEIDIIEQEEGTPYKYQLSRRIGERGVAFYITNELPKSNDMDIAYKRFCDALNEFVEAISHDH